MEVDIDIDKVFDILDKKYVSAIIQSSKNLINSFLDDQPSVTGQKISCSNKLLGFWTHLSKFAKEEIEKPQGKFCVHILPLNRVGAVDGFSGSKVFVAYFTLNNDTYNHSNPLIFKLDEVNGGGGRNKLNDEKNQADSIKPFVNGNATYFAFPYWLDTIENISILWAPFSSAELLHSDQEHESPILKENNLWKLLNKLDLDCTDKKIKQLIADTLSKAYSALLPIHKISRTPPKENKNIVNEYNWYLRQMPEWTLDWYKVWGNESEEKVRDFDVEWINPFYVFEKLKTLTGELTYGAIHGDLHPRNIVFSHEGSVKIIDFGWTQSSSHIVKDFVLMECNLRFMALRPDLSYNDVKLLAESIASVDESFSSSCEYCNFINTQILNLRRRVCRIIDEDEFQKEYLIPLFLVSLGLMRYSKNSTNIISARLTVLYLAKSIYGFLNGGDHDKT